MAKARITYHVPSTWAWNPRLVSESFVRVERERTLNALANLNQDESNLDDDCFRIEQEIRGQWATANANVMRAFQERLYGIKKERARLNGVGKKLNHALKQIHEIGAQRGWKF